MKKIDYSKIPESETIVRDVYHRFKIKKLGTTIYVIGLSGTGKSSTSQRLAELITEKRIAKNQTEPETFIVDSLLAFLEALMKCKLGDIIIIEEISVLFPSRRAMAKHLGHTPNELAKDYATNDVFNHSDKQIMRSIVGELPGRIG